MRHIAIPRRRCFRLFDAVSELVFAGSPRKRSSIVVVLDDLHAADVSTLQMLHFIARHAREEGAPARCRDDPGHQPTRAARGEAADRPDRARSGRAPSRSPGACGLGLLARSRGPRPRLERRSAAVGVGGQSALRCGASSRRSTGGRPGIGFSAGRLPLGVREAIRAHVGSLTESDAAGARGGVRARSRSPPRVPHRAGRKRPVRPWRRLSALGSSESFGWRASGSRTSSFAKQLCAALTLERRSRYHRAWPPAPRTSATRSSRRLHWLSGGRPEDADRVFIVVALALQRENARFAYEDAASLGHRALDAVVLSRRQACELPDRNRRGSGSWLANSPKYDRRPCWPPRRRAARGRRAPLPRGARSRDRVHRGRARRDVGDLATRRARDACGDGLRHAGEKGHGPPRGRDAPVAARGAPGGHVALQGSAGHGPPAGRRRDALCDAPVHAHDAVGDDDSATRYALAAETIAVATKLGQVPLVAPLFAWQVAACIEQLGDIDAALRLADPRWGRCSRRTDSRSTATGRPSCARCSPISRALRGRRCSLARGPPLAPEANGLDPGLPVLFGSLRIGFLHTRSDAA